MVRPGREAPGSHLGQPEAGPRFHFACGFRKTQRLARMLDSLVRVSRRVGWRADQNATNPQTTGPPDPSKDAVSRHGCPVSASRTSREGQAAYADGVSSVSRRIGSAEPVTVPTEANTYLARRLLTARKPVVALCLRKVHTGEPRRTTAGPMKVPNRRPRRPPELNPAGRLCGSTRLPLGGFTYC